MGDLGNAALVVETHVDGDAIAAQGLSRRADLVGAVSLPAPVLALASSTMRSW
jgi:hypothetical protein